MFTSIAGKSVVVTGGTRGIGKGIARVFARTGAKVLVVGRDAASGKATANELRAAGGTVDWFAADVSSWNDVQRMAAAAAERHGGIDILCANAGIFPQAKIADITGEEWDRVFDTNLKGTFFSVRACLPHLQKKGGGRIIVTSSITGPVTGYPGWSHYGASKAGQLGFIRTAAIELARDNITINAVMPGNIRTEGLESLGEDYAATMAASIPLKRLGSVEDIGYAALYFATPEAAYVTGQTLIIDGGQILPESLEALQAA